MQHVSVHFRRKRFTNETIRRLVSPYTGAACLLMFLLSTLVPLTLLAQPLESDPHKGIISLATVTRGPYLQLAASDRLTVRWRTDIATDSRVDYGDAITNLSMTAVNSAVKTDHIVELTGLSPDTTYFYSVGSSLEVHAGGDDATFFRTPPAQGQARNTRIWVIGDSGTGNADARAVRDAYLGYTGSTYTDVWLMLGDNAYSVGTDSQYQAKMFDIYPMLLRQTAVWPTLGNHDGATADSDTQSGPYYKIFTLPTGGEAGGLASGTEAYYSFNHGNIHFVVLDSQETDRSSGGAMMTWLEADLAAMSQADWLIAYWHHPPYSKGSHDSDTEIQLIEMRENALPILESYGVDLVLAGHSHSYERSYLLDGHYGPSETLSNDHLLDTGDGRGDSDGAYLKATASLAAHEGAVYVVAGNAGKVSNGPLDHPAMFLSLIELGSLVIDIDGNTLDVTFLDDTGTIADYFTIVKGGGSAASATLTGQTWIDLDHDGIQSASESGIANIEVQLRDVAGSLVGSQTTGADGSYNFTGLAAADYFMQVVAPEGYGLTLQDQGTDDTIDSDTDPTTGMSATLTLTDGESRSDLDAGLCPAADAHASLAGRVWADLDGDGWQDSDEGVWSDITVELIDSSGAQVETISSASDGTYLFSALAAGDYLVAFTAAADTALSPKDQGDDDTLDSDADPATGYTDLLTLSAGEHRQAIDAGLYVPSSGDPNLLFEDEFETSMAAWADAKTDDGDLTISAAAALAGGSGLEAQIDDRQALWLLDDSPAAESSYQVSFSVDPNSLEMADKNTFQIFRAYSSDGSDLITVFLRYSNGDYQVRAQARADDDSLERTAWITLADAATELALHWLAASSTSAHDGSLELWIDGILVDDETGIDNDARLIDYVRFGAVGGLDSGTLGSFYLDSFTSYR